MPLNDVIKLTHSSSKDNKNPDYDLGGVASFFEISPYPMNNLFNNITPNVARVGLTDYRCFYVIGKDPVKYVRNVTLAITSQSPGGSTAYIGTFVADEIQNLVITPNIPLTSPDYYGYIIIDVHLGPPLTIPWGTNINTFAANFQTMIQTLPMCSTSTVTVVSSIAPWEIEVTFQDEAGSRFIPLIEIVANRLNSTAGGNFRVMPPGVIASQLCPNNFKENPDPPTDIAFPISTTSINIFPPVNPSSFPVNGITWTFNKCLNNGTGGFAQVSYISLINNVSYMTINLATQIGYPIEIMDEVYVEPNCDQKFPVTVFEVQKGGPVNTLAEVIANKETEPNLITFSNSVFIPWLQPLEGFFVWVQRMTPASLPGSQDGFDLGITGEVYS